MYTTLEVPSECGEGLAVGLADCVNEQVKVRPEIGSNQMHCERACCPNFIRVIYMLCFYIAHSFLEIIFFKFLLAASGID